MSASLHVNQGINEKGTNLQLSAFPFKPPANGFHLAGTAVKSTLILLDFSRSPTLSFIQSAIIEFGKLSGVFRSFVLCPPSLFVLHNSSISIRSLSKAFVSFPSRAWFKCTANSISIFNLIPQIVGKICIRKTLLWIFLHRMLDRKIKPYFRVFLGEFGGKRSETTITGEKAIKQNKISSGREDTNDTCCVSCFGCVGPRM